MHSKMRMQPNFVAKIITFRLFYNFYGLGRPGRVRAAGLAEVLILSFAGGIVDSCYVFQVFVIF